MIDYFSPLLNPDNYFESFHRIMQISGWKDSAQRFNLNLMRDIKHLIDEVEAGTYTPNLCNKFILSERGHLRLIKALTVRDSLLQHVLCNCVLIPHIRPKLIYDNGASLTDRGLSFARKRLEVHLHRHMAKYGTDGYILLLDFRKFFDNIPHKDLLNAYYSVIPDKRIIDLLAIILKKCDTDISYIKEPDEYQIIFSALDDFKVPDSLRTGTRYLHKGLAIGAPVSQISGVFYPSPIDNYCKIVRQCCAYGRYMDDIYIIDRSKEHLFDVLAGIREQAEKLHLFVHPNKTHIVKLTHGFTWLKTKYVLTASHGIIKRISRDNLIREKQKIKSLCELIKAGIIEPEILENQFKSWIGDKNFYHAYHSLKNLTSYYKEQLHYVIRYRR